MANEIQRWQPDRLGQMVTEHDGTYVSYADHRAVVERLEATHKQESEAWRAKWKEHCQSHDGMVAVPVLKWEQHTQQAERIRELEQERESALLGTFPGYKREKAIRCQLEAQLAEAREALRFYADPQTYGISGGTVQRIIVDAGQAARRVLGEE